MKAIPTRLEGPMLLEPTVHGDHRGFFAEAYRRSTFAELGIADEFVQDNHSRSTRGIVRGLHFQLGEGIGKLVRCVRGEILDVVVDIRRGSPTFGEWEGFEISEENLRQVWCPVGFAHGFCVVSEEADVIYKQTGYYDPELDSGIAYDDPEVGVEWPANLVLIPSEKDAGAPHLSEVADSLPFEYSAPA